MNQTGRDFLSSKVEEMYKRELEILNASKPEIDPVDDILKACFMAREDLLKSREEILANLEKAADTRGAIEFDSPYRNNFKWVEEDDEFPDARLIKLSPWIFFNLPKKYKAKLEKYKEAFAQYQEKVNALRNHRDALLMKIQIGSDKILAPIVDQVDSTGTLQLINSRVVLIGGDEKSKLMRRNK